MPSLVHKLVLGCLLLGSAVCPCAEAAVALAESGETHVAAHHSGHHDHAGTADGLETDSTSIELEHCCDLPAVVASPPDADLDETSAAAPYLWRVRSPLCVRSVRQPKPPPEASTVSPVDRRDRLLE